MYKEDDDSRASISCWKNKSEKIFASYSISGSELLIGNFGRLNSLECLYIHYWSKGECWIEQLAEQAFQLF